MCKQQPYGNCTLPTVLLLDGCVSAVCQRAAAPVAQARDVVFIAAEVLDLRLGLEAAVPMVDNLCVPSALKKQVLASSKVLMLLQDLGAS